MFNETIQNNGSVTEQIHCLTHECVHVCKLV